MDTTYTYIAIDIAKERLQVQWPDRCEVIKTTPDELDAWVAKVRKVPEALVVFEATGGYERPLMWRLWKHRVACCLVDPRRLKGFAQSEGIKAKTDAIDARLILRFALQKRLQPQPPKEEHRLALVEWMDRRAHLSEQLTREKNRLYKASKLTSRLIEKMIKVVQKQIAEVDQAIEALLAQEAELHAQAQRLQSVKGVGRVTAWNLLAYLPEIGFIGRNQLVALAGLAPYNRDSGNKTGKRYIQAGRAKVRRCLYMAAVSAATHNPHIKAYVDRLRQNGKAYKVAITAAMRKLLIHLQSHIKNDQNALA
jgi:transposase